jgi:predicted protein tyrosine phosphatase
MSRERIIVGPLSAVDHTVDKAGVSHLVTLINGETLVETPSAISHQNHLRLSMNDISTPQPGLIPPHENHVSELVEFTAAWDRAGPVMVHCWAGISRSTAAAFIMLCTLNPKTDEEHIAQQIRAASPTATPNQWLVRLADARLKREGRMISAVDSIGRGEMTMEADVFVLPANLPSGT